MEQVELPLKDVVKIADAAKQIDCSIEHLLGQAANNEFQLYAALKPHAATLRAIPSHPTPHKCKYTTKQVKFVAIQSHYTEALACLGSADISNYEAGFEPPLDWHYWQLDAPQTVNVDRVYFPISQLPVMPDDASAKDEDVTPRQRQDALAVELDEILGSMEGQTITPAKVMAKLREQIGKPNTCITANTGGGLTWENDHGDVKTLTIGALGARIKEWKKTRPSQG